MNTPSVPLPDHNHLAAEFDRFLPLIHPVALALLDHLPEPASGELVLDVSCGTGEPGLTLLRRSPGVRLLGIDSAAALIGVAQSKASRDSLTNARFEVMSSDALALADQSVDAVISRFGFLMFGDVPASAREVVRVLRARGSFSLAVWDDLEKNTLMNSALAALRKHLPETYESPVLRLNAWAAEGVRTKLLRDAGMGTVDSEMFSWTYAFSDFEEAWDLVSRMGSFTGQSSLSAEAQRDAKDELFSLLAEYRQPGGAYSIPHACRLIWGRRGA
jgi:ubiquinone/menaquinone biosynthesis C-methylase UbiE